MAKVNGRGSNTPTKSEYISNYEFGKSDKECNALLNRVSKLIAPIFIMPCLNEVTTVEIDGVKVVRNIHGIDLTMIDNFGKQIIEDIRSFKGKLVTIYIHASVVPSDLSIEERYKRDTDTNQKYMDWIKSFVNTIVGSLESIELHINSKLPEEKRINLGTQALKESIENVGSE